MPSVRDAGLWHRRFNVTAGKARGWVALLAISAPLIAPYVGRADDPDETRDGGDAATLAAGYVSRFAQQARLISGNDFRTREIARLLKAGSVESDKHLLKSLRTADAEAGKILSAIVEENHQPLVVALEQGAADARNAAAQSTAEWQSVRLALTDKQIGLFQIRASKQIAGQLASLLSADKVLFWFFGLLPIACLLCIALHDRRHELRRALNGGKAKAMGISKLLAFATGMLVLATLLTFAFGDRIYNSLLSASSGGGPSPREKFVDDNEKLAERIADLEGARRQIDDRYDRALAECKRLLNGNHAANARSVEQWERARRAIETIFVESAVRSAVAKQIQVDVKAVQAVDQDLAVEADAIASFERTRHGIRGGLGLGLACITVAGGYLVLRVIRGRKRREANRCPRCLKWDTLKENNVEGTVRCDHKEAGFACNFEFAAIYREWAKLCMPTFGIVASGKTSWLATAYYPLIKGNYPEDFKLSRIKSSDQDAFDRIIEAIVRGERPGATQSDRIPHPVVFDFEDGDRLGKSHALVNIFDYSGEVTKRGLRDSQRRRALDGNGFLFFLDPTDTTNDQPKALEEFRKDFEGLHAGRRMRVPVALCVSKIDLLSKQPYAKGSAVDKFFEDLNKIGWKTDMASIMARSKALSSLCETTIWRGWRIERSIHDVFGGRCMFFPQTIKGLGGGDRSPVGVLDPLFWLLHMNGYPVLK